tara:strand:- start:664 stop:912 length:249 start_codon:yes stop_codon:yes gene_type:complete
MGNINILAPNVEALRRSVVAKLDKEMLDKLLNRDSKFTLLHIKREDCGCEFKYQTELDIPSENVICEHNNKVIYYTDDYSRG